MVLRLLTPKLLLPLVLLLSIWRVRAEDDAPIITEQQFESRPTNLFYFDGTDIVIVEERQRGNVWRSTDAGGQWDLVKDIDGGEAWQVWKHPFDNQIAYVLGQGTTHWITSDQGETWRSFDIGESVISRLDPLRQPLSFHAGDSQKVLLHGIKCEGFVCHEETFYTTDGFQTTHFLRQDTRGCTFADANPLFRVSDQASDDRIFCTVMGIYSPFPSDHRLLVSDDYFDNEEEPALDGDRTVKGIIDVKVNKGFLVAAAKAENTDELALYVTDDANIWHRAEFPENHKLTEKAYTILESTNYSIQMDVMNTSPIASMGVLFSSNSNGTYFTPIVRHTNRNLNGIVDFEKIRDIQGILLVNVVDNWEEVERGTARIRKVKSRISFDDGRTVQPLTIKGGKEELHLHSVTDMSNIGRVYSSAAPGLVMGIGNTGDYLKEYRDGDLYVSDDAGLTWTRALKEAQKYEFGDQGSVLMSIYDEGATSKFSYSTNHGKDWEKVELPRKVQAELLTTTSDSTSLKFVLIAGVRGDPDNEYFAYSIDFEGLHKRKCGKDDFEKWYARLDEQGEPDCLMGQKQYYNRRKPDNDCFVDKEFFDPHPQTETTCTCSKQDFECDYNFVLSEDGTECIEAGPLQVPEGECKSKDATFMGSSGWRLIPGNKCNRKGGDNLDEEVQRPCGDSFKAPASGKVSHEITNFRAKSIRNYFYLEKGSTSKSTGETVVMQTDMDDVYISHDHGKSWEQILEDENIIAIRPHQYNSDRVFFLTGSTKVFYSVNRGAHIDSFDAPTEPALEDRLQPLSFHAGNPDWLIWTGNKCTDGVCHDVAYISEDRGFSWNALLRYVRNCEFVNAGRRESEQLVYCEQHTEEKPDAPLQLVSSDNWFKKSVTHFSDVEKFATMSEFIIVATKDEDDENSLRGHASVDGKTFADALFPPNFKVPVQKAYTVLDSSTHAVFLHVTVGSQKDFEYGSIIKSNSNGTSYVMSIDGVNRDSSGYVDFEKMQGIEGVAIVNTVDNIDAVDKGQQKMLKTMITHNDGAEWALLKAPETNSRGQPIGCDVSTTESCSLHLHGFTERKDGLDTFSSPSAVGLMLATGNVGDHLTLKSEADTFISRDAGITWSSVKDGNYMWGYGDQGSIIVVVEEDEVTDMISYSLDEGKTWVDYKFSDAKMTIDDITSLPSDTSRNFLLWCREEGKAVTVNLDFTGIRSRECQIRDSDYYSWTPKHPSQDDNCLFGHILTYHRKNLDAECFNGPLVKGPYEIAKNCSCVRQDFEWYVFHPLFELIKWTN